MSKYFRNADEWSRFWGKDGEEPTNPFAGRRSAVERADLAAFLKSPEYLAECEAIEADRKAGWPKALADLDAKFGARRLQPTGDGR